MFIISWKNFLIEIRKAILMVLATVVLTGNATGQTKLATANKAEVEFNADSIKGCVNCLRISGKMEVSRNNNGVGVSVYRKDTLVYVMVSNHVTGRFDLYLPLNNEYKIVLFKPGYYNKLITVNTAYPKKKLSAQYEIDFRTSMYKKMEGIEINLLNDPIVKMKYNRANDVFDFDPKYTQPILDKIDKLYSANR